MCNYVSWIEKDGKLYYLTDSDVYSSHGRQQLRDMRDNDVLGHGAIRAYYGLVGGVDHERRDWWKRDLPDEIKQHIRQGACTRMLKTGLQVDDLDQIARQAPVWALKLVAKSGRLRTRLEAGVRYTEVMGWYESGQQEYLYEYRDGELVREQGWYESGQRQFLTEYADGELVRRQDWYESGQQQCLYEYQDGKPVRKQSWYVSGQQWYLAEYADGELVRRQSWYESGQQEYLYEYRDGKLVQQQGWYKNGHQQYLTEYKDGKPVHEQGWNEDGTPWQET